LLEAWSSPSLEDRRRGIEKFCESLARSGPKDAGIVRLLLEQVSTDLGLPQLERQISWCATVDFLVEEFSRLARGRLERCSVSGPLSAASTEALAYIESHFSSKLSVRQVAAALGMSPVSLSRQFRRDTGLTLHAVLKSRRMECARDLLVQGPDKVEAVAMAVGYRSRRAFPSAFKQFAAVTPREVRRRRSGPGDPSFSGHTSAPAAERTGAPANSDDGMRADRFQLPNEKN
jgi:AraC-like DNA-binding protein